MNPTPDTFSLCTGAASHVDSLRKILIQFPLTDTQIQSFRLTASGDDIRSLSIRDMETSFLSRPMVKEDSRADASPGRQFSTLSMEQSKITPSISSESHQTSHSALPSSSSSTAMLRNDRLTNLQGRFHIPRLHKDILSPYSELPSSGDQVGNSTFLNLALKLVKDGALTRPTSSPKKDLTSRFERRSPKFSSFPMPKLRLIGPGTIERKHRKSYSLKSFERLWYSIRVASHPSGQDDDARYVKREAFLRRIHKGGW